jgi:hypothetical protein
MAKAKPYTEKALAERATKGRKSPSTRIASGLSTREWSDSVRSRIQSSQIINRLIAFANGDDKVHISKEQLRAMEILLKKSLPDLSSIEVKGDKESPLQIIINGKDAAI